MDSLARELALSTALVAATVVIHLIGLDILLRLTGLHVRRFKSQWADVDRLIVPLGIVIGLFVVHGLEIWLYAGAFWALGLLPSTEAALYVSTSAYSTLGESGQVLPEGWRIVGALEAVNGMLLIGWSTAFLFYVLNRLLEPAEEADHPLPRGAIARKPPRRG